LRTTDRRETDVRQGGSGSGETAVFFLTHLLGPRLLDRYRKLRDDCRERYDVHFAADLTSGRLRTDAVPADVRPDVHGFTRDQVALSHATGDEAGQDGFRLYGGNLDHVFLHVKKAFPEYEHFWWVEHDVAFTGDWTTLFGHFDDSDSDLVGTTLTPYEAIPGWHWWDGFDAPDGIPKPEWIRGFFPCFRISARGLDALDEAYRSGWSGHAEAVLPTALAARGLTLEDIGGSGLWVRAGNRNRFYTNRPHRHRTLGPGSFVYRPTRPLPGLRRDRLWHPVKSRQGRFMPWWRLLRQRIRYTAERLHRS
jgi:hypothetical protein